MVRGKFRFLLAGLILLLFLMSCSEVPTTPGEGGGGGGGETFQPLVSYEDLQEGAYRVGSLVIPDQVSEGTVIHIITTHGLYGYLKISTITDSYLKLDYLVYESTDTVLVHDENVTLNFEDFLDLDNDGESDVSYTTPHKMRKSLVNRKLLSFAYNEGETIFCSFSFEAKGDVLNINPRGNFIFTSENFKLYEGIIPSTSTVAFEKEGLPEIELGDYIIDTKTGVFRRVVAKSDVGDYVVFRTEESDPGEAFKILKVRFEDVTSQEMVPLNEDARILMREDKFNYTWNASYNLLDKDYATITANINFDFNMSVSGDLDIGWTGLDHFLARVDGSLSHSLILTGFFEKNFQKHGETDPFIKPKFTFSVYGIPVVLEIPVYLGYDFEAQITGIATAGYNTGVDFYAQIEAHGLSDWDADGGCEKNFERIGPEYDVTGSATLTPYLGVDARVTIAEAFHPTLGVKPFLEASVKLNAQSGQDKYLYMKLDGGVKIDGEVSFKLFGKKYKKPKNGRWNLYEYQKKIWDDTIGFPADPGNLVAFFIEDGSVKLQWSDNSEIEDGYEIYRKIGGENYEKIGQTTEDATTYIDETALQEVQMSYKVRAFCDAYFDRTHSDWSNEVVVINGKPEVPHDPDPEDGAENASLEPYLNWECSDPDGDILYYDVYFAQWEGNSCGEFVKVATDTYHRSQHLENLSPTIKYCWKVVAKDRKGGMSESPVWTFTTREVGYYFLTVNTSPQGLEVSIDSSPDISPYTEMVYEGTHTIAVVPEQYFDLDYNMATEVVEGTDIKVYFVAWNDKNRDYEREIYVDEDLEYTAVMKISYKIKVETQGPGIVTWDPYNQDSYYRGRVTFTAIPTFQGWKLSKWVVEYVYDGNYVKEEYTDNPLELNIDSPKKITAVFSTE